MPKNNRRGQAATISDADYARIFKALKSPKYRMFLAIARYTGARWGHICQLRVSDVYRDALARVPHEKISFPDGKQKHRQLPLHPLLKEALQAYFPPTTGWLFPGRGENHIAFDSADKFFREALAEAGLDEKGISTHSTRSTFIERLANNGADPKAIQKLAGFQRRSGVRRYLRHTEERVDYAIALL